VQNANLLKSAVGAGNSVKKANGRRMVGKNDINRVRLEMYAARQNRSAAINLERFIELCKEVIQEGAKSSRSRALLIKLRAELGYLYPHITSPGIVETGTGKTEIDEIFCLTGEHMNPPFDIKEAINKELLCEVG
jgi:hypothetical protein